MNNFGMPIIPDSSIPPEIRERARVAKLEWDIENRHTYHPPKGDQIQRYATIRESALQLGVLLARLCPESRELSLALTKLDEVVFFSNASIARNE